MILIDSIYINNGGGKVLLNYLVKKLEETKADVFYLFDERCINEYKDIPSNRKQYLKSSLRTRNKFYKENKNRFSSVLCFGNLAPTIKLSIPVYTYFHQPMYLHIPKEFNWKQRIFFQLKILVFSKLLKNTNHVLVQSDLMKEELCNKYKLSNNKVLLYPFYPNEDFVNRKLPREKKSFIFVSSGAPHKNHIRLISAFCKYYDKNKNGKLYLTVDPQSFKELDLLINDKSSKGYPIFNLKFIEKERLLDYYNKVEFLIFPSLEESFGLGLAEAIDCGCKVIGADLPYLHAVCKPSLVFNPLNEDDIVEAFEKANNSEIGESEKLVENKIYELIDLLNNP